jgi:hypothetical protein
LINWKDFLRGREGGREEDLMAVAGTVGVERGDCGCRKKKKRKMRKKKRRRRKGEEGEKKRWKKEKAPSVLC